MKLKSLLSTLLLLTVTNAWADSEGQLIEQLEARLTMDGAVTGRFEQAKFIAVLPAPLQSHGRFSFSPEEGLDWETLAPIPNRLTFNEQGIRQTMDGDVVWEVDAQQPAAVTMTQVISSVLAMDWDVLQAYFQLQGQMQENAWTLRLEPRDEVLGQIVDAVSISGDRNLESMTLLESNGDRTEIRFILNRPPGP